ncbi:MAG: hypothetical protein JO197_12540 [Acidobacteria bacterium]|nr:hypothetical protein [Acidobacteriota bacterium]MBV9478303.1 hypothetical protein [Acidobacteriota bacterium]
MPNAPLRVAVRIAPSPQPAWIARVVDAIRDADFARIVRVVEGAPRARERRTLYEQLDDVVFRRAGSAFEPREIALNANDNDDVDVVLDFAPGTRLPDLAPRFGVWTLRTSDALAELASARDTTLALLEADGRPIASARAAVDAISLRRGTSRLFAKAASLIISELARLHRTQELPPRLELPAEKPSTSRGSVLAQRARAFLRQRKRDRTMNEQWFVAFGFGHHDYAKFHALLPPDDRLWADPFVFQDGAHTWLFVEEMLFAENRGTIAVMELRRDGTASSPRTVLTRPYHLSYPCVFAWNGAHYMLPETGENETIELYRATNFPYEWEPHATLMRGLRAVDATLFEHAGRWWLYVSTAPDGETYDELSLYHADSPLGPWTSHPRNPLMIDVTAGRCAGRPFLRDGRLLRPAQNGARRYGHSIALREIVTLTTEAYEERAAGTIEPDWNAELIGTHTLNIDGDAVVIDGLRYRPR